MGWLDANVEVSNKIIRRAEHMRAIGKIDALIPPFIDFFYNIYGSMPPLLKVLEELGWCNYTSMGKEAYKLNELIALKELNGFSNRDIKTLHEMSRAYTSWSQTELNIKSPIGDNTSLTLEEIKKKVGN